VFVVYCFMQLEVQHFLKLECLVASVYADFSVLWYCRLKIFLPFLVCCTADLDSADLFLFWLEFGCMLYAIFCSLTSSLFKS
jgi:hypothetical protein